MTRLEPGDPAPLFAGRATGGEDWWLSTAAGDRVVLTFADDTVTVGWPEPTHTIRDSRRATGRHSRAGPHRAPRVRTRLLRPPGGRVRPRRWHGQRLRPAVRSHGRTVPVVDHTHKRRSDLVLTDPELRAGMKERIKRRLLPEIRRAFQLHGWRPAT